MWSPVIDTVPRLMSSARREQKISDYLSVLQPSVSGLSGRHLELIGDFRPKMCLLSPSRKDTKRFKWFCCNCCLKPLETILAWCRYPWSRFKVLCLKTKGQKIISKPHQVRIILGSEPGSDSSRGSISSNSQVWAEWRVAGWLDQDQDRQFYLFLFVSIRSGWSDHYSLKEQLLVRILWGEIDQTRKSAIGQIMWQCDIIRIISPLIGYN